MAWDQQAGIERGDNLAEARPVTTKDLTGLTICYSDGEKPTYLRGGKYENNMVGNGTWSVTSVGVQIHAEHFTRLIDFEIQPDRTISIPAYDKTGKDCK